ncbi:MAG TPA: Sec-dependent nitrous-oxide reductase [Myxococcota bacterium]
MSKRHSNWLRCAGPALALASLLGCGPGGDQALQPTAAEGPSASVAALMKERGLSEADVNAALKTYMPTGKKDDYYIFSSGGQSGQVLVIGIPSMRILKYISVFTPEPWQGWGFGDQGSEAVLAGGDRRGMKMRWGDTHHPNLSETNGDYDGQFLFIGDKANARMAVINLTDFSTTQIVANPILESDHGAAFVTPNTEYVIEGSQYPAPLGGAYAPIEEYNEKYRGAITLWKFDRASGRIKPEESFAIEAPPYMQDLADAGKLDSDGWAFVNSFNTERAHGGNLEGQPPLESGASQNDMDYLHVVNWKKAEELYKAGKTVAINGFPVIPLETAAAEGVLTFVPEPKSPHGADVTPDGKYVVVGGKLDTHATVYDFAKIKALIEAKDYVGKDPYGVPILDFQKSIKGQVELGLGPLHTVFDDKGNAYTSMFVESKIAKWSLSEMKLIEKLPVHYNIGHIAAAHGDTVKPQGHWVVAMNKWAIDRFADVGPLLPQNFQLVDVSGPNMQLVYDLPIPLGEPHYTQIVKADRIKAIDHYSPVGSNSFSHEKDPNAVDGGQERIERRDDGVHVYMTQVRSHFTPDIIRVKQGETVHLHMTNLEQAKDATHGFGISSYNIALSLEPGEHDNVTFQADHAGVFPFYCLEFCSALHLEMAGYLIVEPAAPKVAETQKRTGGRS